jgi:hypothetical protein
MRETTMSEASKDLVRRLDHVIIRVHDPYYEKLHTIFSETFDLPESWPVNEQPGFRSGGVFAGNVDLEILHVGAAGLPADTGGTEAHLYGTVFEAAGSFDDLDKDLETLAERGIPYIPSPYVGGQGDKAETWWMNIFLGDLLGSTAWMKVFFTYKRVLSDSLWLQLASRGTGSGAAGAKFLFDKVYPYGTVFLVKYNPVWRDIDAEREGRMQALQSKEGGGLGLVGVQSVELGLEDFDKQYGSWARLLAGHPQVGEATWQVGDGPLIRAVPDSESRVRSMVWEVRSLERAEAFLRGQGMMGEAGHGTIQVEPTSLFGLDIQLVAA